MCCLAKGDRFLQDSLVSIVIPTFNRAEFLKLAIDSCLSQSYQCLEVIVVDDGSTDDTEEMLEKMTDSRLRYFKTTNAGAPSARNLGLTRANGLYIKFLDSDDVLAPRAIENQVLRYQSFGRRTHTVVVGFHKIIDILGNITRTIDPGRAVRRKGYFDLSDVVRRNPPTSTPLYKTEDLCELGGFDESLGVLQDYDLVFRLSERGFRFYFFPDYIYGMRDHDVGPRVSSVGSREKASEHFRILDRHFRKAMILYQGKLPHTLKSAFLQRYAGVLRKLRRSRWDEGLDADFRRLSGLPWAWSGEAVLLMALALIRR